MSELVVALIVVIFGFAMVQAIIARSPRDFEENFLLFFLAELAMIVIMLLVIHLSGKVIISVGTANIGISI